MLVTDLRPMVAVVVRFSPVIFVGDQLVEMYLADG
jgi:hypothetical protein